jgi:hypothetical protein
VVSWGNGTTTLRIDDINSVLGRATIRVGATLASGDSRGSPSSRPAFCTSSLGR